MKKIILASASEGRQELFTKHFPKQFISIPSGVPEEDLAHLPPSEMVTSLALRKARHIASQYPNHIICAFDTTIECQGSVLGKPSSIDHARDMLTFLNGKTQTVWSGYGLIYQNHIISGTESSQLVFHMDTDYIEHYIHHHPVTKFAGAYAIQKDDSFISIISGSMDIIIGAPMNVVCEFIAQCSEQ